MNRVIIEGEIYEYDLPNPISVIFNDHLECCIQFILDLSASNSTHVSCKWTGEEAYKRRYELTKLCHSEEDYTILIEGELWNLPLGGRGIEVRIKTLTIKKAGKK